MSDTTEAASDSIENVNVPAKLLPGTKAAAHGYRVSNAGAPSSQLRDRLRGSFRDRVPVLEQLADRVGWVRLRERCEHCGREPSNADDTERIVEQPPTVSESLRALEIMAKYGLGTVRGISVDELQFKLAATVAALMTELDEPTATRILGRLQPIWEDS